MNGQTTTERTGRRWSVAVATIAGVSIRVHVTFLALVALVALTTDGSGRAVAAAVGWLVVVFACVVAHELAHSLVARSKGIAVHEIDLLPIGGVSRLERVPDDWRDEGAIAAAGPIASLAITLVAFGVATAAGLSLLPVSLWEGPLPVRLAWANLMLAGFNLLPAFPLDGGRVLRALFERDRSRIDATRRAAHVSRALAVTMIGLGFLFNLWLAVIGLFVVLACRAEEQAVLIHAALGPVPARTLAVPCPVVISSDLACADAARLAAGRPQPAYPVTGPDGRIMGTVDLGRLLGSGPKTPVGDLTSRQIVSAEQSLEEVAEMIESGSVLATDDGTVIGVITRETLEGYLRQRQPHLTR